MRFLWRNAVFILFPAVVVAIIFLGILNIGTATQYGEWGERSMAESAMIVTKDKIERVEHTLRNTDDAFFNALDPKYIELSCNNWRNLITDASLIKTAFIIDEYDDIVVQY